MIKFTIKEIEVDPIFGEEIIIVLEENNYSEDDRQ